MATDAMPGLAKVRRVAATARRSLDLVGVRDGWFSALVEAADIVSEGAVQVVDGIEGYYGSTSIRCAVSDALRSHPDQDADLDSLAELVLGDATSRLRLLRLAHREAVSRAGARVLGVLTAEISAEMVQSSGRRVLAVDIDVSAGLLPAEDPPGSVVAADG